MPPRKGGVFMVDDGVLRMPPEDKRKRHPHRYVIIISGDAHQRRSSMASPAGSANIDERGLRHGVLRRAEQGLRQPAEKCWARVTLTQPLLKADLRDYCGRLLAAQVDLLEQNLLAYMGLVD
jgi:mRNA-degrading endonuclease toxin of MazEF toxin-antitoxin module